MENNNKNIEEDRTIEITLDDGTKAEGEILFTFEANGDDFVLYELKEELFGAKINEEGELKPIAKDEWSLVEKVYEEYKENFEEDE